MLSPQMSPSRCAGTAAPLHRHGRAPLERRWPAAASLVRRRRGSTRRGSFRAQRPVPRPSSACSRVARLRAGLCPIGGGVLSPTEWQMEMAS